MADKQQSDCFKIVLSIFGGIFEELDMDQIFYQPAGPQEWQLQRCHACGEVPEFPVLAESVNPEMPCGEV